MSEKSEEGKEELEEIEGFDDEYTFDDVEDPFSIEEDPLIKALKEMKFEDEEEGKEKREEQEEEEEKRSKDVKKEEKDKPKEVEEKEEVKKEDIKEEDKQTEVKEESKEKEVKKVERVEEVKPKVDKPKPLEVATTTEEDNYIKKLIEEPQFKAREEILMEFLDKLIDNLERPVWIDDGIVVCNLRHVRVADNVSNYNDGVVYYVIEGVDGFWRNMDISVADPVSAYKMAYMWLNSFKRVAVIKRRRDFVIFAYVGIPARFIGTRAELLVR